MHVTSRHNISSRLILNWLINSLHYSLSRSERAPYSSDNLFRKQWLPHSSLVFYQDIMVYLASGNVFMFAGLLLSPRTFVVLWPLCFGLVFRVISFYPFLSGFLGDRRSLLNVSTTPFAQVGVSAKTTKRKESRIGMQPIAVPSNVTISLQGQDLKVKGPLGELALTYPPEVELTEEDSGFLRVRKTVEIRRAKEMHGLFRTLTDNMVVGVSKGFEKTLELKGVGYRAMVQGKELVLNLGFSHPVKIEIPDSLKVKVDKKIIIFGKGEKVKITIVIVSGYDKCKIGQFAATVRKWRPAEPYKRIGVCYSDEIVHRKKGKDRKLK
ncbi:hypothetical protein HID58_046175 [Brassica napus]|uniref:Large ribosomal subunit protein uL6 alpha-beta domain-containing protein n=1 Tax=Brassica napus TaxID=3708 RepID=A0ABQ8AVT0_BRANA|nr:hypothetical protein HID58_046175 [Brassica napus]